MADSSATTTLQVAENPLFSSRDFEVESTSLASQDSPNIGNSPNNGQEQPIKVSSGTGVVTTKPTIRKLIWVEYFILFLLVTFAALMIASTVQLLHITPYEPVFWLFIFSMIFYWLLSFTLVGLSMYINNLQNEEEKVTLCSKPSCMRNLKRVSFWIFIASLICSFACMMLLLKFVLPESFFPSTGLQLQRLAGVNADSASFWIRDPFLGEDAEVGVLYRLNGSTGPFSLSSTALLTQANDYSTFIRLSGLSPATAYEWKFANTSTEGTFSFKTNPAPGQASQFSFYFGSCFLHNFPNFEEAPGFGYVLDTLQPDIFTFLGDFIYSDIPFFRNDDVATYHSLYRHSLGNSHVQRLFQSVPNYHMWDDHEVRNNYPDTVGSNMHQGKGSFENAISSSWQLFLGGGNPVTQPGKTYFDFDYGDSSFIFLDTRVARTTSTLPDGPEKTILGQAQKDYFKSWLLSKNTTDTKFKFVMSPLPWTNDHPSVEDSWGGYKTERDEILEFIRENRIEGVVLFSGDTHFAYAVEIGGAPGGIRGGFYEFSASPISAFDFTLGGYFADALPFKPEEDREDIVLFETIGRKGAMSLMGLVRVDTTKPIPEIVVEFYDAETKLHEIKLELTQLRPWEATQ